MTGRNATTAVSPQGIHDVLRGTAELFRQGRWTQRQMALDARGHPTGWVNPEARHFCIPGGVCRTALEQHPRLSLEHAALSTACLKAVREELQRRGELKPGFTLGWWNTMPEREAKDAVAALESAASRMEGEHSGEARPR